MLTCSGLRSDLLGQTAPWSYEPEKENILWTIRFSRHFHFTWPIKSMKPSPDLGTPCSGQSVNQSEVSILKFIHHWPIRGQYYIHDSQSEASITCELELANCATLAIPGVCNLEKTKVIGWQREILSSFKEESFLGFPRGLYLIKLLQYPFQRESQVTVEARHWRLSLAKTLGLTNLH